MPPSIPLLFPTWLSVLPQQEYPPCVATQWASSCLWPLYAKYGISHQLLSTDTPAVREINAYSEHFIILSLSPLLSSTVSLILSQFLPGFLSLQLATQLIVCWMLPRFSSIALFLSSSCCQSDRCGEVHDTVGKACVYKCLLVQEHKNRFCAILDLYPSLATHKYTNHWPRLSFPNKLLELMALTDCACECLRLYLRLWTCF